VRLALSRRSCRYRLDLAEPPYFRYLAKSACWVQDMNRESRDFHRQEPGPVDYSFSWKPRRTRILQAYMKRPRVLYE
jgi:hypothetical protein